MVDRVLYDLSNCSMIQNFMVKCDDWFILLYGAESLNFDTAGEHLGFQEARFFNEGVLKGMM